MAAPIMMLHFHHCFCETTHKYAVVKPEASLVTLVIKTCAKARLHSAAIDIASQELVTAIVVQSSRPSKVLPDSFWIESSLPCQKTMHCKVEWTQFTFAASSWYLDLPFRRKLLKGIGEILRSLSETSLLGCPVRQSFPMLSYFFSGGSCSTLKQARNEGDKNSSCQVNRLGFLVTFFHEY